jgi:hypothetical protein
MRFLVLTAAGMKVTVSWRHAPCSLVEIYQRFRCFADSIIRAIIAGTYETKVSVYKITRRNILEDSHLQSKHQSYLLSSNTRWTTDLHLICEHSSERKYNIRLWQYKAAINSHLSAFRLSLYLERTDTFIFVETVKSTGRFVIRWKHYTGHKHKYALPRSGSLQSLDLRTEPAAVPLGAPRLPRALMRTFLLLCPLPEICIGITLSSSTACSKQRVRNGAW